MLTYEGGTTIAMSDVPKDLFGKQEKPLGVMLDSPTSPALSLWPALKRRRFRFYASEIRRKKSYWSTSLLTADTCRPLQSEISSRNTNRRLLAGAVILTRRVTGHGLPI